MNEDIMNEDIYSHLRREENTDPLESILAQQINATSAGHYAIISIPMQVNGYILSALYCDDLDKAHCIARKLSSICSELTFNKKDVQNPDFFNFRRTTVYDSSGNQLGLYLSGVSFTKENYL